jgi:hypothetical protein
VTGHLLSLVMFSPLVWGLSQVPISPSSGLEK